MSAFKNHKFKALCTAAAVALAACGGDEPNHPNNNDDAGVVNPPKDGGCPQHNTLCAPDSGTDAGEPDAGEPDAGVDAGIPDAGVDAGEPDSGTPDAGELDAGTDGGTDPISCAERFGITPYFDNKEMTSPFADCAEGETRDEVGPSGHPVYSVCRDATSSVTRLSVTRFVTVDDPACPGASNGTIREFTSTASYHEFINFGSGNYMGVGGYPVTEHANPDVVTCAVSSFKAALDLANSQSDSAAGGLEKMVDYAECLQAEVSPTANKHNYRLTP